MGRKRRSRALDVYVGSTKTGRYSRVSDGSTAFRYDPDWLASPRAFPISLSMPLSDRIWSREQAASFFDGLLPDDRMVREKIAAREQADSAGVFDLLAVIGRDCVGALRFVPEGHDPGDPATMLSRPVDDDEIARRLAALGTAPLGMTLEEEEFRISIAGVQEKTAFLRVDEKWHVPMGATPTSHIFKPPIKDGPFGADFSDTPWNEWLCLELCRALGLAAAQAEVKDFDGTPVLVVERFDRLWKNDILYRLPQEDICQALGVPPSRKYQSGGGPGMVDVLDFLKGSAIPREDRLAFMRAQIVNWLQAAIDGHAKNFSVFLTPGGFRLTPIYDVMSAAPYKELQPQKVKLAMAAGENRHYRVRDILPRHFYQTGQKAGLRAEDMDALFSDLDDRMDDAVAKVEALAKQHNAPSKTAGPILDGAQSRSRLIR